MINRRDDDMYITSMKQYIANPLAWFHTERIKRAADNSEVQKPAHNTRINKIASMGGELFEFIKAGISADEKFALAILLDAVVAQLRHA